MPDETLIEANADRAYTGIGFKQPVIISLSVPKAMTTVVKADTGNENEIDIMDCHRPVSRRFRDTEASGYEIIRGPSRIESQLFSFNLRKESDLAFFMHQGKEIHLSTYRKVQSNGFSLLIFGKRADIFDYPLLRPLLFPMGDSGPPF
ncbi:MAG TPA: hypothetical protein PLF54_06775 [Deltaproteobacteria bacterium]|nr:hypothetical protein [Deltaproteobacteria bacterium]